METTESNKRSFAGTARGMVTGLPEKLPIVKLLPPRLRLPIIGVAVLVIVLTVWGLFPAGEVTEIPVIKVKKGGFLVSITESGEIVAKNATAITAPRVRGNQKIVFIVPEGTRVKAGDTVLQFDPTEALNNLREAEMRLEVAIGDREKLVANQKSQLTKLESDLKGMELTFELSKLNLEQMKFEAAIKQQEAQLQHKKNELSLTKAKQDLESQRIVQRTELSKLDIDVQQKRADLERAKRDLEMLVLTAPQDGLVVYENNWSTGRKIAIGDTPWPGMTLLTLPDLSAMLSVTYVNEVDVSRVRKGLRVNVRLDAFRDTLFEGEIMNVAALGRSKDNTPIKVFEVNVLLKSQSELLKPGMTTSNRIVISEIPGVLSVPQEAVFEKHGRHIVYVKKGSGFTEREVELGEKSEDFIVIKSGLTEKDEVALRDPFIKIEEQQATQSDPAPQSSPNQPRKGVNAP